MVNNRHRIGSFILMAALMSQNNHFEEYSDVLPKTQKKPVQKKGVNAYYFDDFGEIIGVNNEPSTKYLCRIDAINKKNALRKFAKKDLIKFKIGAFFYGKWYDGLTEIISIDKEKNLLRVKIHKQNGQYYTDDWNLQHTIWGFENGEYWWDSL